MTIFATILISSMLAVCGLAQVRSTGACPDLKGIDNFSISKFAGRWHEARRFYSRMEDESKCNNALYSTTDSDDAMQAKYRLIYRKTKEPLKMKIDMTFADPKIGQYTKLQENIAELVLDTDYENYAILWNCRDATRSHAENAWILTRSVKPSKKVIAKALKRFESFGLDKSILLVSDQTGC